MHQGFTYGLQELLGAGYKLEAEQLLLFEESDGVAMFAAPLPMLFDPWGTQSELDTMFEVRTADGKDVQSLLWPVLLYYSDAAAEFLAEYDFGMLEGDWPELIGTAAWSDNMEMHSEEGDHYEPWELWPLTPVQTDRYWEVRNDFDDVWVNDITEYVMLAYQAQEDAHDCERLLQQADRGVALTQNQTKSLEDMELMRKHVASLRERIWDPGTNNLRATSADLDFESWCSDTELQDAWFLTKRSMERNLPICHSLNLGLRKAI